MSRIIKFRAWSRGVMTILSLSTDHWVYFDEDGLTTIQHDMELMQFTGLQDCEGKDVYEGDVLQPKAYLKVDWARAVVIFHKGIFCLDINKPWIVTRRPLYQTLQRSKKAANDFIVIGNIHTNPELLEQS